MEGGQKSFRLSGLLPRKIKCMKTDNTRMSADAQRDGRPSEYRWRPLFNAAKFG